jgi:hypothetical protein
MFERAVATCAMFGAWELSLIWTMRMPTMRMTLLLPPTTKITTIRKVVMMMEIQLAFDLMMIVQNAAVAAALA